jgi:pimeloyl-ACP methyl ester carboxylesterase
MDRVADFLPAELAQLTEATSIAMASQIQRSPITTPLSPAPIATAFAQQGANTPPILLLHGFDSSLLELRCLFPLLARQYSTWAIDLLGFGFTDRPSNIPFTPAAIKTHLYHTWKTLIGKPVILVGASMGGAAAIDLALTYPDAVQKLVLIDSAGFTTGPEVTKLMVAPVSYLATEFLRHPWVRRKVSLKAYCDPAFVTADATLCAALHLKLPRWRDAIIAFTKSGGYNFLANKISQIAQPTLIIWGDRDRILGTQDATWFQQAIAHSQLVWISHCGHVPHLEQPQITCNHILRFAAKSFPM